MKKKVHPSVPPCAEVRLYMPDEIHVVFEWFTKLRGLNHHFSEYAYGIKFSPLSLSYVSARLTHLEPVLRIACCAAKEIGGSFVGDEVLNFDDVAIANERKSLPRNSEDRQVALTLILGRNKKFRKEFSECKRLMEEQKERIKNKIVPIRLSAQAQNLAVS